ncbi:hypothetical protein INS49_005691 [Diaporthe citri]|uniref:uncharacterized protein n=1 Tax=Diaporthe citri TaxID=83186 RepID=UPI001C82017F|nr:uncharacterized protein INS49_005691 [Diaporthe citri]KAG6364093.1 hypothetical protein INS49_005691 [Diaporthe citri]
MSGAPKSKVWAILVGINAYPTGISDLGGCVRDIQNVEKFLSDNIDASRLEILKITAHDLNGEKPPNYDNIVGMIDHVKRSVNEKDFVYFHYSGHGGRQLRHYSLSSGSHFESLVLHGERHMKDYELGRHLDSLAGTGAHLFAVLDCCHSGGGDRINSQNVRQIDQVLPADPHVGEGPDEESGGLAGTDHRAATVRPSYWTRVRNYTLLAACQPHQFAMECRDNHGEKNGALTLAMLTSLETLRQNGQPLTFKSLFWDLRARIGLKSAVQNPKLFGIEDRDVFSHGSYSSARQATVVNAASGRVCIDQGEIQGVKDGETWNIYPRGVLQLESPLATVRIDRVGAIQASGLLAADAPVVERGCPVSLVSPVYGTHLRVLVGDTELRQQLMDEPAIGVTFHEVGYVGAAYTIRPTSMGHQEIIDTSGTPLLDFPGDMSGDSPAAGIHKFLKALAHHTRVLNIRNTRAALQGKFEFGEANNATTVCDGGIIYLEFKNLLRLDRPGSDGYRAIETQRKTLYFSVLNLRADKTVTLLVPDPESEGVESVAVAPEESKKYPIDMNIQETDGDAGEVTDVFKVIVTDRPSSFRNLATEHAMRGGAEGQEDFNEEFDMMLHGGNDGFRAGTRRDVEAEARWQTAQVSVTITRNSTAESSS